MVVPHDAWGRSKPDPVDYTIIILRDDRRAALLPPVLPVTPSSVNLKETAGARPANLERTPR